MRALQRKLLRDLARMRGQVITITLIVASGIAAYVCMAGAHRALAGSREAYYARHGFPDVFAHLERAPDAVADRLRELPGVASIEPRLVAPVTFRIPGMARPPAGRAVSEPSRPEALVLRAGRALEPGRDDEVLLLETFARAHGLTPGDPLDVVIDGNALALRVAGLVLSPEWIFPAEAGMASDRDFGVLWMTRDALGAATGKQGAFDDVTLTLVPGTDPRGVVAALDRELAPWGGAGAYGRDRQVSNKTIDGELAQLAVLANQVPAVFLTVAAFLLAMVLSRIVHLQREQLAVLRALGYSRAAVGRHVLGFAGVITLGGIGLGLGLGRWLAGLIVDLYGQFFHFPVLEMSLDRGLVLTAVALSALAAGLGAIGATWRAVRLAPAEAMRPPAPARYRRGLLSRLGLARLAGPLGRMVVRDLERRPVVSGLSVLGIAFAAAIVVLGRFSTDAMDFLMDVVFARTMREDLSVVLARPVAREELGWFRHAPGVLAVEPMRAIPVRLRAGHRRHDTAITAWPRTARLRQLLDGAGRPVALPDQGLLLTDLLATRLGLRPGDPVTVERLEGDHATFELPVAGLVDERLGMNAYMELDALTAALGEEPRASTVLLAIERPERERLLRALEEVPAVVAVIEPRGFRENYDAQAGEMMMVWTLIVVIFGSVIAIGVVFNTGRVALSERSRDLATLRVLGFTRDEVARVLLGQLAVQVVLAVPLGMLVGHVLANLLMSSIDPEQFRLPALISPATYAFASLVVLGSALATAIVVRRRLDRLDLVSALKARD